MDLVDRLSSLRTIGAVSVVLTIGVIAFAVLHEKPKPKPEPHTLVIPHVTSKLVLDGETDDDAWLAPPGPARTGAFHFASGERARPYSEARIVWKDDTLVLALYAADEDIRTRVDRHDGPLWIDDAFRVTLSHGGNEWEIDVSPKCIVTDGKRNGTTLDTSWESGVRVACDTDGTINDSSDMDEEWVVEMAIPLAAIGVAPRKGETLGLSIERCDTPKHDPRVCGFWGDRGQGRIILD